MVSVSEATSIIESHLYTPKIEKVSIEEASAMVLGEEITSDRDLPPFDRVAMDGIAINFDSFEMGTTEYPIEGVAPAGQPRKTLNDPNHCIEVMTGAPLPIGTDTVIRYEDINSVENKAAIKTKDIVRRLNVHARGQDAKGGEILLLPGVELSPVEIALIASVGKSSVKVKMPPNAAIISTGDELVGINEIPKPHQIRRSNSYTLQAALKSLNCSATLYHIPDERVKLESELATILDRHDLLILTGGVSKGKFDFVPQVLDNLGVKKHFHKVKQKPGKPFWFGTTDKNMVFALPGNPVSTTLCFYKYIKPWLLKSLGISNRVSQSILTKDFDFEPDLTYFLEANIVNEEGKLMAHPMPGGGSGDFAHLKEVNGFVELPQGINHFREGEAFSVHLFRD